MPSPDTIQNAVLVLPRGEMYCYYRGYLINDREMLSPAPMSSSGGGNYGRAMRDYKPGPIARTADLLLALAERGAVHLLQVRHGAGDYSYLAVRR